MLTVRLARRAGGDDALRRRCTDRCFRVGAQVLWRLLTRPSEHAIAGSPAWFRERASESP